MPFEFALVISAFLTCFNVLCAVVFWRRASELTSQTTRSREAIRSVESFESRIDELHKRINSISRKYALEDRRDPETGKSRRREDDESSDSYDRKVRLRRQYGLAGLSHVDIARRALRPGEDA
jgi:hypothetical protein